MNGKSRFVAYRDYNSDENQAKPLVVCAHAVPRNSMDFDYIAKKISQTGKYRVVAFDFVGRGRSEWLAPDSEEKYDNATYSSDISQLLTHLNREHVDFWIGSSLGGVIGMFLCMTKPGLIKHLILNDSGAIIAVEGLKRLAENGLQKDPKFKTFEEARDYLKQLYTHFFEGPLILEMWNNITNSTFHFDLKSHQYIFRADPKISAGGPPPTGDVSLEALWKNVKCPTLVLRGKNSDIFPVRAVELMKTHREFDLIEFENCGHIPSLMFDHQTDPVLKWIQKF